MIVDRMLAVVERIARIAVWTGGGFLLAAAFMVTVDVILRKLFSVSMAGADEIMGYIFAISTAWAFSLVLLDRSNVRIDALYQHLPRIVRAGLDIVGLLVLGGFMFLLTKAAWSVFTGSLGWPFGETEFWSVSITPLLTPLAVPQGLWLLGLMLFLLTIFLILLRALLYLLRGDISGVLRVAGPRSQQEEVEEELHMAESLLAEAAARDKSKEG